MNLCERERRSITFGMRIHVIAMVLIGCSSSSKPVGSGAAATGFTYYSDCSLTNPVARDPCEGPAADTRGLQSCTALGVKTGDGCSGTAAPGCYNEITCADGHRAVAEYLVCATETPGKCFTRSSRAYKHDIEYVARPELAELARQVESLRLARFRHRDQVGGPQRLGFITEDAPGAAFVSSDGRTVDLYALLSASIAAIQIQDERIRALEGQMRTMSAQCRYATPTDSEPNPASEP